LSNKQNNKCPQEKWGHFDSFRDIDAYWESSMIRMGMDADVLRSIDQTILNLPP
jgi:hypothetical protein